MRNSNGEGGKEQEEIGLKRMKMSQDLNSSVFASPPDGNGEEAHFGEQISQITDVTVTLDRVASHFDKTTLPVEVICVPRTLDLNDEACNNSLKGNAIPECINVHSQVSSSIKGLSFDLNAQDFSSSTNPIDDDDGSSFPSSNLKSRDIVSECGSTSGPLNEKDPLTIWKEMKQNGFLSSSHGGGMFTQSRVVSSSHGGIPVPRQRGRKSKSDVRNKKKMKMELGKREPVDRLPVIPGPSGLLNGLNPGIINHVRNKKQVHSIIEALVRSEKFETKQTSHIKGGNKDITSNTEARRLNSLPGIGSSTALPGTKQTCQHPSLVGECEFRTSDKMQNRASATCPALASEVDILTTKISSSSAKASDQSSSFSNKELANNSSVSFLSTRAASVASQWLELLSQDIKGRLSALRRSKKRVRAVISTELPFLISKEFSSDLENHSNMISSSDALTDTATATMHHARWGKLFDQMDKALSEEEKQLESWLYEVKEMQLHCDHGLQNFQLTGTTGSQHQGTKENRTRSGKADGSTRELAVRAAAASIYSTCNFLNSKENVSCF